MNKCPIEQVPLCNWYHLVTSLHWVSSAIRYKYHPGSITIRYWQFCVWLVSSLYWFWRFSENLRCLLYYGTINCIELTAGLWQRSPDQGRGWRQADQEHPLRLPGAAPGPLYQGGHEINDRQGDQQRPGVNVIKLFFLVADCEVK